MIIGGITAGAKTNSFRTGYSERFLPMSAFVIQPAVKTVMEQNPRQAINYVASARIRNVADTAWTSLPTVSYFQVIRRSDGYDTASVTIQKPESWSPYIAGAYADLLKPSSRILQIYSGIRKGSTTYQVPLFSGYIEDYRETQGPNGGAMNLELIDCRKRMESVPAPSYASAQTAYRAAVRMSFTVSAAFATPFKHVGIVKTTVTFGDYSLTSTGTGDVISALLALVPGVPVLNVKSSGPLVLGAADEGDGMNGYGFTYSDSTLLGATRSASDAVQFNTVRIQYGTTLSEVSDAADVVLRGKIYYSGYIGGSSFSLATATAAAQSAIALSLRGRFDLEIDFNPFIDPGSRIKISSTRFALVPSYATVGSMRHQYTAGRARTYLDSLSIVSV